MASSMTDNDAVIEGINPSEHEMTTDLGESFQNLAVQAQDSSAAVANILGIAPEIVSNPLAQMPPVEVQELIATITRGTDAGALAIASTGAQNPLEGRILTAASIKKLDDNLQKLDDDLQKVNVATDFIVENAENNEGWMKTVRHDHEKKLGELQILVGTLMQILTPSFNDAQKAKMAEARMAIEAMKAEKDRQYMAGVTRGKDEYKNVQAKNE